MKKLMIILSVAVAACTGEVKTDKHGNETAKELQKTETILQLNDGRKWKADEATRRNVAAMVNVVNDRSYTIAANRGALVSNMQSNIDTLVKECRMKGPEHDALHVWLEEVLKDMKALKEEDGEYINVYIALKKDVESFYGFFE